jgi:hypothetical protein
MTNAKAMLETYPRDFNVDADVLSRCVDECYACAETCAKATPTITSTAGSARSRVGAVSRRAVSCSAR